MADIEFTGNLAEDPEIRFTPSGRQVTRLRVTENLWRRSPETGEWEKVEPNVFRVQVWRSLGENAGESLHKGQTVNVKGHIVTDRWKDKETGEDRTSQVVVAEKLGPDLRWQTVEVTKAPKKSPGAAGVPGATDGVPEEPQKRVPFVHDPQAEPATWWTPGKDQDEDEPTP